MKVRNLKNNIIGRFNGMNIPITVDTQAFYQHFLVCGSTGSGKSNSMANLIKAAQALGACCIVFDHKPDYQDIDAKNDETRDALWSKFRELGLQPFGLKDVQYFGLAGQERRTLEEVQVTVRASDVEVEMLAAALFPSKSEDNQRDLFLAVLDAYKANHEGSYSLARIWKWIDQLVKKQAEAEVEIETEEENGDKQTSRKPTKKTVKAKKYNAAAALGGVLNYGVNASTFEAMDRKVKTRKPEWLDTLVGFPKGKSQPARQMELLGFDTSPDEPEEKTSNFVKYFDFQNNLERGRVIVIRVMAEGREYGLFLSYMLAKINHNLSLQKIDFPVICFVDEAHDIFQGERTVAEAATTTIMRAVNKGRSLGNGFVFSTQNPSQLPTPILNNLNSRIIHRQNEEGQLKLGIPGAPTQLMRACLGFGPGEALVYIQGSRAPIRAEMAPSPFKLTKLIGQGARKFMSEQLQELEVTPIEE